MQWQLQVTTSRRGRPPGRGRRFRGEGARFGEFLVGRIDELANVVEERRSGRIPERQLESAGDCFYEGHACGFHLRRWKQGHITL